MRSVSVRLADLIKTTIPLGYVGENEYTKVIFDCKKVFDDYPSAIQALTVKAPKGDPYPVVTTREDDYVVWEVEGSSLAYDGSGEFQLTFTSGNVIVKSYTGRTRIEKSIVPVGEAPDAITDWITGANNVLNGIPQEISDGIDTGFGEVTAEATTLDPDESATASFDSSTKVLSLGIPKGEKGDDGDPGDDGYSPLASVSKSGSTATISITDKDGTTTATVSDGDPTSLIDDTAGDGDTGKTWSADKLVDELGDKYELPSGGIPSSDMASAVQTSLGKADTAYQKPSGGIPADDIASGVIPSVTGKADKVSSAVNGNFAGLDSNGNLTDSGHKHSDYLTSHQDITGKADKVSSATSGDFAGLDGNGNLTDSGKKASDFVASSSFYATEMPMASDDSTKVGTEIGNLKSEIQVLEPSATSGDVGKVLKAKTVTDGKVSEYEFAKNLGAANNNTIKAGGSSDYAVTTSKQDVAVYYGLSKLAGVDLASETVTVGTYPATSQSAIRSLIGAVGDVQVDGTSAVTNGVANLPIAVASDGNTAGLIKFGTGFVSNATTKKTDVSGASSNGIKDGLNGVSFITPNRQHESVFYGLAKAAGADMASSSNAVGVYTESAKSAIAQMLDAPETVSGSTPSITVKAGVRYVCGEVSTLSVTLPSSGDVEIIFESGSTATILTLTPPSGVTSVKFPAWFDPTDLEANVTYDMIITNGEYGVVTSWA